MGYFATFNEEDITTGIHHDSRDLAGWEKELKAYKAKHAQLVQLCKENDEMGYRYDELDIQDEIAWMECLIEGIKRNGE